MVSVEEALKIGTRHHQSGDLVEAERVYRQILQADPRNAHAMHQLGMLALQSRNFTLAVQLIGSALQVDRSQAAFHGNLGEAYRHLGQLGDAIDCYRKAVKLQPTLKEIQTHLGIALHTQGHLAEAAESLRQALRIDPDHVVARAELGRVLLDQNNLADAESCFRRVARTALQSPVSHFELGTVLQLQGKSIEAAGCFRTALILDPRYVAAHVNLGTALQSRDRLAEAAEHYEAAIAIEPDFANALYNLGSVREVQGQRDAAIVLYERAVRADPKLLIAQIALGASLEQQGKTDEAWAIYQHILADNPQFAPVYDSIGRIHRAQGKLRLAVAAAEEAIRLDPTNPEYYNNLGVAWSDQGRRDEALVALRRSIELKGSFAYSHGNLGVALQALGQLDEAILHHRKAVELNPENFGLHSNLLYALNYHPASDAETLFEEHRAWGQRHADPLAAVWPAHANDRTPDRRLRLGYVSAHFLAHAVNSFSEPILAHHDHAQFEVFCYSNVDRPDETTARLRGYADHWRDVAHDRDDRLSQLIADDKIDILVDLTGHIGGNRLMAFARKPAPIQVTYIGYQNTTGMRAMDYRLTDEYSDPAGETEAYHTETLVRLPGRFFCYLPSEDAPAVTALPAIANGHVTFGSFNNVSKITPQVLEVWSSLLTSVPGSRLIVLGDMTSSLQHYLQTTFTAHGVGPERLELSNRRPRREYLDLINRVDIALDPFPFNGHTTTCDCLWQGVPVVTLSGRTYVTRFGGSALATLALNDLVTRTPDEYVCCAVQLATDRARLQHLRSNLRSMMMASPLLDFQTFTRSLETEYRRMWIRWCAT